MGPVYLQIPVRSNNEKPCPDKVAGDMGEHLQGALVGIVQVLQDCRVVRDLEAHRISYPVQMIISIAQIDLEGFES